MKQVEEGDARRMNLAVDEGKRLLDKLPADVRGSQIAGIGALAYGVLRAIMECPVCGPGYYRVPSEREDVEYAVCYNCKGVWVRKGAT